MKFFIAILSCLTITLFSHENDSDREYLLSRDYLYGTSDCPRYILGETEEARVFEMSDYSFVFKMGDHFFQPRQMVHLKDCPGCVKITSSPKSD